MNFVAVGIHVRQLLNGLGMTPICFCVCEMIVIIFPPSLECDDCFAVPSNGNAMVGASFQLQPRQEPLHGAYVDMI